MTAEILRALTVLGGGGVVELRVIRRSGVVVGYFDDYSRLASEAAHWSGKASGIYVTLNPVVPSLLARGSNTVVHGGKATADTDIESRHWLPLDFDPVRPSGISSTDAEHEAALERALEVQEWLGQEGWPAPVRADSGNGAHLLYRVDLPNDRSSKALIESALKAISIRFSDAAVKIDTAVGNAARIWKLYGTQACKGEFTPDRPHRFARIVSDPSTVEVVPRHRLEKLAAAVPQAPGRNGSIPGPVLDVSAWLDAHGVEVLSRMPWEGGEKWILRACPWNREHTNRSAYVVQFASGAIAAGCHHDGCTGKGWHDLRDLHEPNWRVPKTRVLSAPPPDDTPPPGDEDAPPEVHSARGNTTPPKPSTWPDLIPLDEVGPVPPFPVDALHRCLRNYVVELSEATQTPADMAGMMVLGTVAACIGGKVELEIHPGYREPTNIYALAVMAPAERKSSVHRAVVGPLVEWEKNQAIRMHDEVANAKHEREVMEGRLAAAKKNASRFPASSPDARDALDQVRRQSEELEAFKAPVAPRVWADDATAEALTSLLAEYGGRMALLSAEAGSVLTIALGRYSQGSSSHIDVLLKGHSGDPIRVDRRGRPPELIERPALTIASTVQPSVLRELADAPGLSARGFLARFLVAVPQSRVGKRVVETAPVSAETQRVYTAMLTILLNLQPAEPMVLRLSPEAHAAWNAYAQAIEARLAPYCDLCEIGAWAGKLPGAVGRLAAILHMSAGGGQEVSDGTMRAAIRIGDYLEAHQRVVSMIQSESVTSSGLRRLVRWIQDRGLARFTRAEFQRALRGNDALGTEEERAKVLEEAVQRGYVRQEKASTRTGRPTTTYEVRPEVLA